MPSSFTIAGVYALPGYGKVSTDLVSHTRRHIDNAHKRKSLKEHPVPLKTKHTTRKSLAWSFSQQFGQYGLQFIGSVFIARLLTPDEVGIFALAMAANFFISSIRDFGVGTYLVREQHINEDKVRTAYGIWIIVSWTLGLILVLSRNWLADAYDSPGIAEVIVLLSVSFFLGPFGAPAQSMLMREMRFDILHHVTLTAAAVGTVTSVGLAFNGFSYMSLAWGMIAAAIFRLILLLWAYPNHLKLLPGLRYWRDVVNFGGFVTGASLVGTASNEGPKFILGALINPAGVALFERAVQIPTIVRQGIFGPLGRVLLPSFSRDIRNGDSIGTSVEKLVAVNTVIVWPAFVTVGLLAEPIIVMLFGENWRIAGQMLPYILISQGILALLPQPDQILLPHGEAKRLFFTRFTATSVNLAVTTLGAAHSLMMFAMLRPAQSVIAVLIFFYAIRKFWQTNLRRLRPIYMRSAEVVALSALPAVTATFLYDDGVPVTALFSVAITAPLFWVAAVFVVRHPLAAEIRLLLKSAINLTKR